MDNMNNNRNTGGHKGHKGFLGHGLLMMLCCMLPILLIAGLPLLGVKSSSFSFLIFLLCPLMHVGMMFMMRGSGKGGSCHGNSSNNSSVNSDGQEVNSIEERK